MRPLLLSWLAIHLFVGVAHADKLYLLPEEAGALPREEVTVLRIPGALLLVTPDDAPSPSLPGIVFLAAPDDWDLFLYRMEILAEGDPSHELLRQNARILHDAGDGWLVVAAPREGIKVLDGVHADKQRLSYIPFTPNVPSGARSVSSALAEIKDELVGQLNLTSYSNYIRELSGDLQYLIGGVPTINGDRYTYANSIYETYDYFADRFASMGYTVQRQYFPVGEVTAQNIIAIRTGSVYPDSIIVVGGHMDAVAGNLTLRHPAPGAEDNASGAAGVLHLAEAFADYQVEKTIHFIGFGAEEQGLYGSEYYVQQAQLNGDTIIAALTMDMIAAYETQYGVIVEGEAPWDWLMTIMKSNTEQYGGIPARKVYGSFGSDHVPFSLAGISTFLAIDEDWFTYDYYHRSTDTYDKLDPALGLAIVKGVAGTLADLTQPLPLEREASAALPTQPATALRNEPNPFNPATVIRFELAENTSVSLEVLDVVGRRVRLLQNGWLDAGPHSVRWNGEDHSGIPVASGVYFYRLDVSGTSLSGRMALVR